MRRPRTGTPELVTMGPGHRNHDGSPMASAACVKVRTPIPLQDAGYKQGTSRRREMNDRDWTILLRYGSERRTTTSFCHVTVAAVPVSEPLLAADPGIWKRIVLALSSATVALHMPHWYYACAGSHDECDIKHCSALFCLRYGVHCQTVPTVTDKLRKTPARASIDVAASDQSCMSTQHQSLFYTTVACNRAVLPCHLSRNPDHPRECLLPCISGRDRRGSRRTAHIDRQHSIHGDAVAHQFTATASRCRHDPRKRQSSCLAIGINSYNPRQ
nr:hypothetical protein CFP56_63760 [Quercus suber]